MYGLWGESLPDSIHTFANSHVCVVCALVDNGLSVDSRRGALTGWVCLRAPVAVPRL